MQYSLNVLQNINFNSSAEVDKIYEEVGGKNTYVGVVGGKLQAITKEQVAKLLQRSTPSIINRSVTDTNTIDLTLVGQNLSAKVNYQNSQFITITENILGLKVELRQVATKGIVAYAGGGQLNATPLLAKFNRIDTVATIGDSTLLPKAVKNDEIEVQNTTSNAMDLFPFFGEQLENGTAALGANVALSLENGLRLICYEDGIWSF